jgi:hypothetical protein
MRSAGFNGKVMAGPFSGLTYEGINAFGSMLTPKLLGTYELELWEVANEIIATRPSLIIDIGAAEGYYAVGLAAKLGQNAEIIAFETNTAARNELTRLAANNGVGNRIRCLGECTSAELGDLLQTDCLIICDCEGAEVGLLDPLALPQLRNAAILVELHDGVVDDIVKVFLRRFSMSHAIMRIAAKERKPSDCAILRHLRRRDVIVALSEQRRLGKRWMWMKPYSSRVWRTNQCSMGEVQQS